jgi:hypothetical protein
MGRINFANIISKYNKIGKGNVRLTQSTLIISKPIQPTVATYQFDVLETQTSTLVGDEIRLNLNDEFVITTMGVYLEADVTSTLDGRAPITGGRTLFTYVPLENKGDLITLNDVYNGALQIAVNNIVYLDKWDTKKHECRPRTQYGNFSSATTILQAIQASSEFSKNAMFPVEPLLTLSGAKKNTITLTLPNAVTAQTFNLTTDTGAVVTYNINRICLVMRGLNAQNGASFQN